jgi:formylglycine-generating enzyme required for sulfatase activity
VISVRKKGARWVPLFLALLLWPMAGCADWRPWRGLSKAFLSGTDDSFSSAMAQASAASATTTRLVSNHLGMEFVLVPAGEFVMGGRGNGDEQPMRRVSISRPFYMGRFPVTQAQWQRIMGKNPSWKEGCATCPVEQVSWRDVQIFLRELNAMGQGAYRLPTEAEWEYAARAGSTGEYGFGDDPGLLGEYAWFYRNTKGGAQPVGQKPPNAWGLHDMHGNVWELVHDWYGPYPASGAAVDPIGPGTGRYRVIRGGSWTNDVDLCRAATRMKVLPGNRHLNLGFRLALIPGNR